MKRKGLFFTLLLALGLIAPVTAVRSQTASTNTPTARSATTTINIQAPPTGQIIIKFVDEVSQQAFSQQDLNSVMADLSQAAGVPLAYGRPMSGEAHVLQLPTPLPLAEVAEISAKLSREPGVIYAEPDAIRQIDDSPAGLLDVVPNDTRYSEQWHYGYTAGTAEGINLPPAWQITTGMASTVVAVIDTGILNHADLAGKTVPGYDFITNVAVANDGNGRDSDPSDPGDWITANECFLGSPVRNSSWHGTHVAGTISAASNNSQGVAGVNWLAKILPIRVLGKCGGSTSDIVDGARWAAGLSVPSVPANANPADVLNLSLGGSGSCSTTEQNAFTEITAAGTTVITAAGNSNSDASNFSPGNCNNVITVAANDRGGDRAFYSNFGSVVEVSGPGGETTTLANGVLSTLDGGTTTPANDNAYAFYQGTSMATPHVAGVASLILGQQPSYTPAQVLSTLQTTARSFPTGSSCNTSICGSGIVDAFAALDSLKPPDTPQLTLKKTVVNNDGGTAGASAWTLTATGDGGFSGTGTPTDLSDVMALNGPNDVKAGVKYALTESGPGGYVATAWSCDAGTQDGANITLALGDDVTCEITNNDIAPKLTLKKTVVNNNDGTAGASAWTLTATGLGGFSGTGTPTDLSDVIALNGPNDVKAGVKYALTESGPGGYVATAWSCDAGTQDGANITLALGDDVTCEIANYDNTIFIYLPLVLNGVQSSPFKPITNPGFEQGQTGWTESSTHNFDLILNESGLPSQMLPLPGGQWAVWLGGADGEISFIEQTVTVLAGAPYLTYWHWIASNDFCGYDFAKILIGNTEAHVYDLCFDENTSGWQKYGVDLSVYAGQSVALQIRIETDPISRSSSLFVDDVSFESQAP